MTYRNIPSKIPSRLPSRIPVIDIGPFGSVNIGDMMARWTNDRWKSTVHRVVNPPRTGPAVSRRQSIGYFLHPDFDARVECLPTSRGPDNPPKYAPIMAGEHMREKLLRRVEA